MSLQSLICECSFTECKLYTSSFKVMHKYAMEIIYAVSAWSQAVPQLYI